jgi:hypothetical protein
LNESRDMRHWCALFLTLCILWPRTASSTTIVVTSAIALARDADTIVVGTVVSIHARWERRRIVSDVDIRVERSVKGQAVAADVVRIRVPGGTVAGVAMRVLGAPQFATGERALLLLARRGNANHLVGLADGKLTIRRGAGGSEWVDMRFDRERAPREMPLDAALRLLATTGDRSP